MNRPDDWASAIYRAPEKEKVGVPKRAPVTYSGQAIPAEGVKTLGFDARGLHTEVAEDMVAKRVETDRSVRYFAKFSTAGSDIGHLFNPVGLYFRPAEVKRDQAKTGRARYEFRQLPETAFHEYMKFLQTRVESFLRSAERQVLDA